MLKKTLSLLKPAIAPFNPYNFIESVQGLAITPTGSPILSTAQKKFGTSSLYLGSSLSDLLSLSDNNIWHISQNYGGLDFWVYPVTTSSSTVVLVGQLGASQGESWETSYNGSSAQIVEGCSGTFLDVTGTNLTMNTWNHLEFNVVDSSQTLRIFLNGTLISSHSTGNPPFGAGFSGASLSIGGSWDGGSGSYYMDELRFFSVAHAHTSNFTPPTVPYTNSDALALFHFDG